VTAPRPTFGDVQGGSSWGGPRRRASDYGERAYLKSQGFSDREIDEYLGASADPAPAPSRSGMPRAAADVTQIAPGAPGISYPDRARLLAQGAGFSLGDEALGAVRGALTSATIPEAIERERAALRAVREAHPGQALATELAGSFLTGGGLARLGLKGATSVIGRGARAVGIGAGQGALQSAGAAEGDLGQRAIAAVPGALFGAGGAVLGEAMAAPVAVGKTLFRRAPSRARAVLAKNLARDQLPMAELQRRAAEFQQAGIPASLADVGGPNVRTLAEASAQTPGRAMAILETQLTERQAAMLPRTMARLQQVSPRAESAYDVGAEIITRRAAEAAPLYEEALAVGVLQPTPMLQRLFRSPIFKSAVREAKALPEYLDLPPSHMALLDKAYKNIGGKADEAWRAGNKERYRDLSRLRESLREEMTAQSPKYGEALQTFRDESSLLTALEEGVDFLNPKATPLNVKALTAGEKEMYRVGIVERMQREALQTKEGGNIAARIVRTPAHRARIKEAFGDEAAAEQFLRQMELEGETAETAQRLLGGSPTARRVRAQEDIEMAGPAGVLGATTQGLGGLTRRVVGALGRDSKEEISNELAAIFAQGMRDPADLQRLLQSLTQAQRKQLLAVMGRNLLVGVGSGVGATAGASMAQPVAPPRLPPGIDQQEYAYLRSQGFTDAEIRGLPSGQPMAGRF